MKKLNNKESIAIINEHIRPLSKRQCIRIHKALGDELRYDIWRQIAKQPGITGKELLVDTKVSQPTLSFHIAQLVNAGIVADIRDGQSHTYYPNFGVILSYHKASVVNKQEVENSMVQAYGELENLMKK